MSEQYFTSFISAFKEADMFVIGVGNEWREQNVMPVWNELLAFYLPYIEKKNYFFITSIMDKEFSWGNLNEKRCVQPLLYQQEGLIEEDKEKIEKQWNLYNKWLSGTLNKKLVLLELGEGFANPNVFRWPFEKITFINQKSVLFRINSTFPHIPENIKERAFSIEKKSYFFLKELKEFMQNTEK